MFFSITYRITVNTLNIKLHTNFLFHSTCLQSQWHNDTVLCILDLEPKNIVLHTFATKFRHTLKIFNELLQTFLFIPNNISAIVSYSTLLVITINLIYLKHKTHQINNPIHNRNVNAITLLCNDCSYEYFPMTHIKRWLKLKCWAPEQ